jgi:hypothetical protein
MKKFDITLTILLAINFFFAGLIFFAPILLSKSEDLIGASLSAEESLLDKGAEGSAPFIEIDGKVQGRSEIVVRKL